MKTRIAALVLAGGQGTRLGALTKKLAKPAVAYGGKYRIIDFPLSCCSNSGINHVGVLTQYESSVLNSYIGNGRNWGLNGVESLTSVLTPKQTTEGSSWYMGTADAVYQNIDWLDSLDPDYVLILSGDHIYSMAFDKMLATHIANKADMTLAVQPVPIEEASRFGVVMVDDKDNILDFKEKPKNPASNLVSMGIYMFNYKTLRRYLRADAIKENSHHDFGKDVLPALMKSKKKICIWRYGGYWKDVGTIASLHEANMDLLDGKTSGMDLYALNKTAPIYTEDNHLPPQYIGPKAEIKDSLINQGSMVKGKVNHCVVSSGVIIEEGAKCVNAVLMPGCYIHSGAVVKNCIVAPDEVIRKDGRVNADGDSVILYAKGREYR